MVHGSRMVGSPAGALVVWKTRLAGNVVCMKNRHCSMNTGIGCIEIGFLFSGRWHFSGNQWLNLVTNFICRLDRSIFC